MNDDDDDLQALLGDAARRHTTHGGDVVELAPIKVRQMAAVARAAAPLAGVLDGLVRGEPLDAMALAAQGDELAGLAAALTGRSPAWVGELELDDLVALLGEAVAVNVDFFARRLQPALDQAARRISGAVTPTLEAAQTGPAGSTLPPG